MHKNGRKLDTVDLPILLTNNFLNVATIKSIYKYSTDVISLSFSFIFKLFKHVHKGCNTFYDSKPIRSSSLKIATMKLFLIGVKWGRI